MFCIKCAQELPEFSLACWKCGNQIPQQVQPIPQHIPTIQKENPVIVVQKSSGIVGAFFVMVLLGALGAGVFIAYQKLKPKPIFSLNVDDKGINVDYNLPDTKQPKISQIPQTPIPFNPDADRVQRAAQEAAEAANRAAQDYRNFNAARNTRISSGTCEVLETSNLKQNCDSANCDDDPNTVVIKITQGSTVQMTNYSNIPSRFGYSWTPVQVNASGIEDGLYYIASKRLRCY